MIDISKVKIKFELKSGKEILASIPDVTISGVVGYRVVFIAGYNNGECMKDSISEETYNKLATIFSISNSNLVDITTDKNTKI